jgi:hypothetical protein
VAENWPELAVSRAVFATPSPKTNITGVWSAGLELTNIYTIRNWTPRPTPRPIGPLQTPVSQGSWKTPEFRVSGGFPGSLGNRVLELSRQLPRHPLEWVSGKLSGKLSGQLPRLVPGNQSGKQSGQLPRLVPRNLSGNHTRPRPDASLGGITLK